MNICDRGLKVKIIGGSWEYSALFETLGIKETNIFSEADIVCFTGGEDVSPHLYGQVSHHTTRSDAKRDEHDIKAFRESETKFKVGICRGGQFLNVMNGGSMWQDVNNHCKSHILTDLPSNKEYIVSSTHHQMMIPGQNSLIVAKACEATRLASPTTEVQRDPAILDDIEVLWYPKTRSLCFQPHPEYNEAVDCRLYFEALLERYYVPKNTIH